MKSQKYLSPLLVLCSVAASGVAYADSASTTGGIKIKSDDGSFEANIGGRVHFDAVYLSPDARGFNGGYGSSSLENTSGVYVRRAMLTLTGKLYGWDYKFEDDLMGGAAGSTASDSCTTTTSGSGSSLTYTTKCTPTPYNTASGFQDIFIAHSFMDGDMLYIGQHKPWRAFEELQSNNEILFMERPITSASGIVARDWQDGLFYRYMNKDLGLWAGASGYSLSKAGQGSTQGTGGNGRVAWAPINHQGELMHIAFSYSSDHADNGVAIAPKYTYGGYKLGTTDALTFASYANATANIWTAELAGIYGPAYFESEFAHESLAGDTASPAGSNLRAYYAQASYFVTGESKSYRATDAVVAGNPKPIHTYGAVELKARYENGRNSNATGCAVTTNVKLTTKASNCSTSDWAVGINYYVNPNVRFMFDYVKAKADLGNPGTDETATVGLRAQLSF